MTDPADIKIYQSEGEWSALYVNGKLNRVGDHYLIDERVLELLNIDWEKSDDFMRGGDQKSDVATTVQEIEDYRTERDAAWQARAAAHLRQQADDLIQRAKLLES